MKRTSLKAGYATASLINRVENEMQIKIAAMRMIAVYVTNADRYERLAADELDPELKVHFETQATAYRRLAAERADKLGLSRPPLKH